MQLWRVGYFLIHSINFSMLKVSDFYVRISILFFSLGIGLVDGMMMSLSCNILHIYRQYFAYSSRSSAVQTGPGWEMKASNVAVAGENSYCYLRVLLPVLQ